MNFLDKKIEEILKNHPSGEDFFNHLDDMIQIKNVLRILVQIILMLETFQNYEIKTRRILRNNQ